MSDDCQSCGACCQDFAAARDGVITWVTAAEAKKLQRRSPRLVVLTSPAPALDPELGLAADATGRCLSLVGTIGKRVSCGVYKDRPRACSSFRRGGRGCNAARDEQGLLPI